MNKITDTGVTPLLDAMELRAQMRLEQGRPV